MYYDSAGFAVEAKSPHYNLNPFRFDASYCHHHPSTQNTNQKTRTGDGHNPRPSL